MTEGRQVSFSGRCRINVLPFQSHAGMPMRSVAPVGDQPPRSCTNPILCITGEMNAY
jgi:hypothetical protein